MAARVAHYYGIDVEAAIWRLPGGYVEALDAEARRIEYRRALPTLLVGWQQVLAHWPSERGPAPSFTEYVPDALRPDPLEGWMLSEEAWRDLARALSEGVGTEELARLRAVFGEDVLMEVIARYG